MAGSRYSSSRGKSAGRTRRKGKAKRRSAAYCPICCGPHKYRHGLHKKAGRKAKRALTSSCKTYRSYTRKPKRGRRATRRARRR